MASDSYRYFIEIKPDAGSWESRQKENEARRERALLAIGQLRDWIHTRGLEDKVSALSSTVFGQVQITCEPDVLQLMREEESLDIVAVRQGYLRGALSEAR